MFDRMTLLDTPNATSSPESECGAMRFDSPAGPTTAPCGQALAPANLSARQAKERGLLTSGTCGLHGSTSSSSAALQSSLVSRLRARTASLGSTLYKLTWKARVTPAGRSIYALRASVRRTSDNDCGSWPKGWATPTARDWHSESATDEFNAKRWAHARGKPLGAEVTLAGWPTPHSNSTTGPGTQGREGGLNLQSAVQLAGWPTCTATDAHRGVKDARPWDTGRPLNQIVALSGWPTPVANDDNKTPEAHLAMKQRMGQRDGTNSNRTAITSLQVMSKYIEMERPARLTATGEMLTGSSAGMEGGGQ